MNKIFSAKLAEIQTDRSQLDAYSHKQSAAVLAGPGSGKTAVLTVKAAEIIRNNIQPPFKVACITFNREAAREIRRRISDYGIIDSQFAYIGTVHSFCISEILRPFIGIYEYPGFPKVANFANNNQRREALAQAHRILGISRNISELRINRERRNLLSSIGLSQIENTSNQTAKNVANKYEEILHRQGLIDLDDAVIHSARLIIEREHVRDCIAAKYPYIFVDEYQDLGRPLHEITLSFIQNSDVIINAFGDPDQSIYGFQGARPEYLNELARNPKVAKFHLTNNYRSKQDIINAFEDVIGESCRYISTTKAKGTAVFEFYECQNGMLEQFNLVATQLIPKYLHEGIDYSEICVLVGSRSDAFELARVIDSYSIPYYLSVRNFDRSEFIVWLEECAKWVLNAFDESFDDISKSWHSFNESRIQDYRNSDIHLKISLLETLESSRIHINNLPDWIKFVISNLSIQELLEIDPTLANEVENIENLIIQIDSFSSPPKLTWLANLGKPKNQVTVSTRHSSKGLEFETIIMLGMEQGCFPSFMSMGNASELSEEERLCFVSISRAKRICTLVRSYRQNINRFGTISNEAVSASQFWDKLKRYENTHHP